MDDDWLSIVSKARATGLLADPDAPRLDRELVGQMYDGRLIYRAHDYCGRYSLFCEEANT